MTTQEMCLQAGDFRILFNHLDEAVKEQPEDVRLSLNKDSEVSETISLFNEWKESEKEASYSTITVS